LTVGRDHLVEKIAIFVGSTTWVAGAFTVWEACQPQLFHLQTLLGIEIDGAAMLLVEIGADLR
jgi:hypothetical protein